MPRTGRSCSASGEHLGFDAVLLATGAEPRHLTVPGSDLEGIHSLRTLADSDRLRSAIGDASRVVVIGGGWIGCEVAAAARLSGAEVAIVEAARIPLERALGPELGAFYRDVHAEHGVEWRLGSGVEELRGSSQGRGGPPGRRHGASGDLFVAGVGVTPRIALAEGAGLTLENGVATDEFLHTSAPGVFAAGDVASAWHPLFRDTHSTRALVLGTQPGAGGGEEHARDPLWPMRRFRTSSRTSTRSAWSTRVTPSTGTRSCSGAIPPTREFIAFWVKADRLVAGMAVNTWDMS